MEVVNYFRVICDVYYIGGDFIYEIINLVKILLISVIIVFIDVVFVKWIWVFV